MSFIQTTVVYSWKERFLGKPCFKPYRLLLYGNGRILLEKIDTEKLKACANLCDIFPYIRIDNLQNERKLEQAVSEGLTLAYHTLVIPLESGKGGWREREYAVSFDREIKEWMECFARVLSFEEQYDQVVRKYHNKKNGQEKIGGDEVDPIRFWSTARGSGDDYSEIWSSFLEYCSAKMEGRFVNGRAYMLPRCLMFQ